MESETTRETAVLFPLDREIVEAVMRKNGVKLAPAIRIIIREFGRINGITNSTSPIEVHKPRNVSKRKKVPSISGVTRGTKGLVN